MLLDMNQFHFNFMDQFRFQGARVKVIVPNFRKKIVIVLVPTFMDQYYL